MWEGLVGVLVPLEPAEQRRRGHLLERLHRAGVQRHPSHEHVQHLRRDLPEAEEGGRAHAAHVELRLGHDADAMRLGAVLLVLLEPREQPHHRALLHRRQHASLEHILDRREHPVHVGLAVGRLPVDERALHALPVHVLPRAAAHQQLQLRAVRHHDLGRQVDPVAVRRAQLLLVGLLIGSSEPLVELR